ncbi:MAG: PAS domain S-box protein [Comamonadaceae bacterium]|nr:MAG: PAS domain S-box protein [Comamonadaceae bacterium]
MRVYPTADGGLAIFYRDVTARHSVQERLRASDERQGFLLALADGLRGLADPLAVVAATAKALGERLGASRVVYADIDEPRNTATATGDWTDGTVPHLPPQLRMSDYGDSILEPLRRGQTLCVADVRTLGATATSLAALDAIGVAAFVSVPLLKNGRFVANINVHQSRARDWTPAEVELIEVVAERAWEALERARSVAELRATEARHRATLEIETVAVVYFDTAGNITDANAAFLRLIGQSSAALHAHQLRDDGAPVPEWRWHHPQTLAELLATGRGGPLEKTYVRPDGSHVCLLCAAQKLDEHTAVEFIIDITERKAAEAALHGAEERLRLAVDNAEIGFWDVDEVNHSLTWPARTKAAFGISPDVPVTMQDFYGGLHPDDRAVTSDAYAAAADPARRALYDVEYRTVGKEDGVVRWVADKGRGVFDADGRCLRVAGTAIDITSRKAAEAALRASEARFEAIANSVDQMVWTTLPDGFHDYYNDRWYEFTGVPKGSTDGEGWIGLFHADDHDRAWAEWRRSLATGAPYHIEYRLRHRTGQYRWVIGRAQCVRGEDGRILRWYGTCTDIHEIVEAREVLARSRAELEQLIDERTAERDRMWETSRDLMLAIGFDGVLRRVNPAWTSILGYATDELVGHHVNEFVLPEDHAGTADAAIQAIQRVEPSLCR